MIGDKDGFIRHIEFSDVGTMLPTVDAWDGTLSDVDLFITAIGFEDRAGAIAQELARTRPSASTEVALLGCYESNIEDNACNDAAIRNSLNKFCSELITFAADGPAETQRVVHDAIARLAVTRDVVRVAFDISGSSSTFILSVMAAAFDKADKITLDIVYAEPDSYEPTKQEFDDNLGGLIRQGLSEGDDQSFAEQGVAEVDVNELYPGYSVENRPDHVLAIPSLRTSRLLRCLAHNSDQALASPDESIFWILSEPPSPKMRWRLDLQRRIIRSQIAVMMGRDQSDATLHPLTAQNSVEASTRDYRRILEVLLKQIDAQAGSNLSLAHMGSKLQGIGVAFALHARREVKVLHARPKRFNAAKYSHGVGTLWRIEFRDLSKLLHELDRIGQLELQSKLETSREKRPVV